ncbi:MAG: phosphatidylglycerophosphatase A [Bacteroidales bacterium]|jgi:phosphatidylglycerophosphatase A|nr:phosphatidylglycerophosphatase A [Bacteroidales bacterium]
MKLHKLIASGLGTGYAPIAPGTVGSLLGIILYYFLNFGFNRFDFQQPLILVLNLVAIVAFLFIGVYAIKKVHQIWIHDAPQIVIDEVIGVWIAVFAIPFEWQYYLYALILFRFFDIVKPLYIRRLDNLKSDWSVMLDDVLAGIYANVVLQAIVYFNVL